MIKFQLKEIAQSEISSCGFKRVGLKGGEYISKRHKIWRALFSIKHASKYMNKFIFSEIGKN